MKEVEIASDINNFNENLFLKLKLLFELILKLIFDLKYILCIFFIIIPFINTFFWFIL